MFETDRGQAGPVAVVLVFAIVIGGTVTVVAFGSTALTDVEQSAANQRAEVTMTQFDASAARVALGESSGQTTSLPSGSDGAVNVDETAGSIQVEVDCLTGGTDTLVSSTSLGSIRYENARTTLAYQGGGVWKRNENGEARVVSPPEFHYRGSTLTLPIILVRDGGVGSENVRISPINIGDQQFPDPGGPTVCGSSPENPIASGTVTITINSEYAKGWGNYFETRTTGTASYPSTNTVVLELTSPISRPALTNAVSGSASGGPGEGLVLAGGGATTDSYDSDSGPYATSQTSNGDIVLAGDVELRGSSTIDGNVRSGGEVDMNSGSASITGDIYYTTNCPGPHCPASATQISGVSSTDSITPVVNQRVADISSSNDNAGAAISSEELDFSATSPTDKVTLTSGTYYVEDIEMDSGETLILDTSGGDITLGIKEYIYLENSGSIEVIGDGRVNVWILGDDEKSVSPSSPVGTNPPSDVMLGVAKGGEINVGADQDASQFFVYGTEEFDAVVTATAGSGSGNPTMVGSIYAPTGSSGDGRVFVMQGEVFGAVVTGTLEAGQNGEIHYDESLSDTKTVPANTNTVTVTYLHITTNEIEVSDN